MESENQSIFHRMKHYAMAEQGKVEGWLQPSALITSWGILEAQVRHGVVGHVLEIGLFQGKFFFLLCASTRANKKAVGIDPFSMRLRGQGEVSFKKKFDDNASKFACDADLLIFEETSDKIWNLPFFQEHGSCFRFIWIDGSHEKDDVLFDLVSAEQFLADNGIIALDDFCSVYNPGVTEAAVEYFATGDSTLVPFAVCENNLPVRRFGGSKLFICRKDSARFYLDGMKARHPGVGDAVVNFAGQRTSVFSFDGEPFKKRLF
jgi:hypothetical protein